MFSHRVPPTLTPNRIAAELATSPPRFDLTVSNPTVCGIAYPPGLLEPLADRAGIVYRPDPRGLPAAREAVAGEYGRYDVAIDPARVVLTASTSEAYTFLFKLLADPGEAVLVPSPSYPLFEHLARVEGVDAIPFHLNAELGWRLDLDELAAAPPSVRAVVVVHPNNPTGSPVHPDDAAALHELAAARGWTVIADEVFLDYPLAGDAPAFSTSAGRGRALTFTLGGLSKSVGLPQLKLAWIVASGPDALVNAALERLEFIADAFLSVATPVQLALPELFRRGREVRSAILERCRSNLATLLQAAPRVPAVAVLEPSGGWSAPLRVPALIGEEELVLELLRSDGVAVHPGYFFDFPSEGTLVLSLLPEPATFSQGVGRLLERVRAHLTR
ncbi:MAG TPA: pyridoxal phosphate-dependent aminotransferase [Thermoanaerobaculaceae bacterium]|nr:pyridoxal phosphate-dependent aminotransferase [Thermoanaerobaculaceae bacterium]